MNILHIITQKPNSTGSGIYMSGMINGFDELGYRQGVIAGIDKLDNLECFNSNIKFYPVIYNTDELPFNVLGMSDVMPYDSTIYRNISLDMIDKLKIAFSKRIKRAIDEIKPDIVICHHLYLLTAYVREVIKEIPVVGICHGTCLKQIQSHNLEKDYIKTNIKNLDTIFSLHNEQKKDIINIFNVEPSKVFPLGSGYDENLFFDKKIDNEIINITFAGKICKLKGVESLIKALDKVDYKKELININIVGDGSNKDEYNEILKLANSCKFSIQFLGKIKQTELAEIFRNTHIFILPSFFEGLPLVVIEALASGCNVITTDIPGVSEWIGEEINISGKIKYIDLPKMKNIATPYDNELPKYEEDLGNSINDMIDNIISFNIRNKSINMKEKTWVGLCVRLKNHIISEVAIYDM